MGGKRWVKGAVAVLENWQHGYPVGRKVPKFQHFLPTLQLISFRPQIPHYCFQIMHLFLSILLGSIPHISLPADALWSSFVTHSFLPQGHLLSTTDIYVLVCLNKPISG